MPAGLSRDHPVHLRVHVADNAPAATFLRAVLRLVSTRSAIECCDIRACLRGTPMVDAVHDGELFPTSYREGIPQTHALYRDFTVPLGMIRTGWNTFDFCLDGGEAVTLVRMELALM